MYICLYVFSILLLKRQLEQRRAHFVPELVAFKEKVHSQIRSIYYVSQRLAESDSTSNRQFTDNLESDINRPFSGILREIELP